LCEAGRRLSVAKVFDVVTALVYGRQRR
jgi:hypothetical protein